MKYLTTFVLLAIGMSSFCQNNNKTKAVAYHSPYLDEIDNSFITHIVATGPTQTSFPARSGASFSVNDASAINFEKLALHYENAGDSKFDFLVDYYKQLARFNKSILDEKFLKKPSLDNLLSIYLQAELKNNTYGGKDKLSKSDLITWELEHFPTMESLIKIYYSSIFYQAIENNLIKESFDIDFNKLDLSKKEGTVLYYVVLMRLRQARQDKGKMCGSFLKAAKKLPTFNGQKFNEFNPFQIDDMTKNIRHQNKYWNTINMYTDARKEIIDQYERCTK